MNQRQIVVGQSYVESGVKPDVDAEIRRLQRSVNFWGVILPSLQVFACALLLPLFGNTGITTGHTLANMCIALLVPVANSLLLYYEGRDSLSPWWRFLVGGIACGIATVYVPIFLALTGCFSGFGWLWFLGGALLCFPLWTLLAPLFLPDCENISGLGRSTLMLLIPAVVLFAVVYGGGVLFYFPLFYAGIFVAITFGTFACICPLLALNTTMRLLRRVDESAVGRAKNVPLFLGVALGVMLVLLPDFGSMITRAAVGKAGSCDVGGARAAVRLLRRFGDADQIGEACRDPLRAVLDVPALLFRNAGRSALAIPTYYRVTGNYCRPDEHPIQLDRALEQRPGFREAIARRESLFAGEDVGPIVSGLSLTESFLRSEVSKSGALVKTVWSFNFANTSNREQEARMELLTPPHAVVSGVWIWMHGTKVRADIEPRAVARSKYTQVVVVQRKDPVLVTTTGPNKLLAQCYPVPPGRIMEIELELAYPMQFEDNQSYLPLPIIAARNFSVSQHRIQTPGCGSQTVPDEQLRLDSRRKYSVNHLPAKLVSPTDKLEFTTTKRPALSSLFVVVDGGKPMAKVAMDIVRGFEHANPTMPINIAIASDEDCRVWPIDNANDTADWRKSIACLKDCTYVGGPDNLPSLVRASMLASSKPNSGVFWIHGPQPYLFGAAPPDQIANFFAELKDSGVTISEYEAVPGPNKIVQSMEDPLRVSKPLQVDSVMRSGNVSADVTRHLNYLSGRTEQVQPRFSQVAPASNGQGAYRTPDVTAEESHLLRSLCARTQVQRLISTGDTEKATQVACHHEIVSPVTGAVKIDPFLSSALTEPVPTIQPYDPGLDGAVKGLTHNALSLAFDQIVSQLNRLNAVGTSSLQLNQLNVAGSAPAVSFSLPSPSSNPASDLGLVSGLQISSGKFNKLKLTATGTEFVQLLVVLARLLALLALCILAVRGRRLGLSRWYLDANRVLLFVALAALALLGGYLQDFLMLIVS